MRGPDPRKRFKNLSLGVITTPFGGKTEQESFHPGVDIANSSGTPIHAPVSGTVVKSDGGHAPGENNFGNTVELKDAEGNTHQFHHLQKIGVQQGQQIQQGQPIATIGKSGAVYSPSGSDPSNLDYRIVTAYGKYRNPMTYLNNL
jgi:murein DD-endopeptidase MepM/ murein hydrolase activator NlpD